MNSHVNVTLAIIFYNPIKSNWWVAVYAFDAHIVCITENINCNRQDDTNAIYMPWT